MSSNDSSPVDNRTSPDTPAFEAPIYNHLQRIYADAERAHAWREGDPRGFDGWQAEARPALRELLKFSRIAEQSRGFTPVVTLDDDADDCGSYTRQNGVIESEPGVLIHFWLLVPNGAGSAPRQLCMFAHGHEHAHLYVNLPASEYQKQVIIDQQADVAVQAVERGFIAIVPRTRGMEHARDAFRVDDIANRHKGRACVNHAWQSALAGRTMLGERLWDQQRLLDWALAALPVDPSRVLQIGHSGGCFATMHIAACDERIAVTVGSCAYNNYISVRGFPRHCACLHPPGLLEFGEHWDVAGLIAPRPLLTISGRTDTQHPIDEVDHAVERLAAIYADAGAPERYEHRWGEGGHRYYADLLWPWVTEQFAALGRPVA